MKKQVATGQFTNAAFPHTFDRMDSKEIGMLLLASS